LEDKENNVISRRIKKLEKNRVYVGFEIPTDVTVHSTIIFWDMTLHSQARVQHLEENTTSIF
jgi:hypothetical protein